VLCVSKSDKTLDRFCDMPLRYLLALLDAIPAGLSSVEAKQRLRSHGPNSLVKQSPFAALLGFSAFANPLVLILLAASAISIALGDPLRARSSSP
jgi:magnesium-transporting ATPase (P-type)